MTGAAMTEGGAVPAGGARADPASRLELARDLLRGMENRAAGVRPVVAPEADGRVLPVAALLAHLFPAGGLRRGSTVSVPDGPGSTSLLLALLAEASAGGAWVGVVGRPELGLVAAAEAGVRLERLALVPRPGKDLLAVTSVLLDGLDIVVMAGAAVSGSAMSGSAMSGSAMSGSAASGGAAASAVRRGGVPAADRQRLAARARQRGSVLLALCPWPGADAELTCVEAQWQGIGAGVSGGSGRLCSRQVRVRLQGRGVASGGRASEFLLPASEGAAHVPDGGDPGAAVPVAV